MPAMMIQAVIMPDPGFRVAADLEHDRDVLGDGVSVPDENRFNEDGVLASKLLFDQFVDNDRFERFHIGREFGIKLVGAPT